MMIILNKYIILNNKMMILRKIMNLIHMHKILLIKIKELLIYSLKDQYLPTLNNLRTKINKIIILMLFKILIFYLISSKTITKSKK